MGRTVLLFFVVVTNPSYPGGNATRVSTTSSTKSSYPGGSPGRAATTTNNKFVLPRRERNENDNNKIHKFDQIGPLIGPERPPSTPKGSKKRFF